LGDRHIDSAIDPRRRGESVHLPWTASVCNKLEESTTFADITLPFRQFPGSGLLCTELYPNVKNISDWGLTAATAHLPVAGRPQLPSEKRAIVNLQQYAWLVVWTSLLFGALHGNAQGENSACPADREAGNSSSTSATSPKTSVQEGKLEKSGKYDVNCIG